MPTAESSEHVAFVRTYQRTLSKPEELSPHPHTSYLRSILILGAGQYGQIFFCFLRTYFMAHRNCSARSCTLLKSVQTHRAFADFFFYIYCNSSPGCISVKLESKICPAVGCWPKGSKSIGRSATSASGQVLYRRYFPQSGWSGYTATTRSSEPRLW
jgi:hypothetical protein